MRPRMVLLVLEQHLEFFPAWQLAPAVGQASSKSVASRELSWSASAGRRVVLRSVKRMPPPSLPVQPVDESVASMRADCRAIVTGDDPWRNESCSDSRAGVVVVNFPLAIAPARRADVGFDVSIMNVPWPEVRSGFAGAMKAWPI